MEFIKGYCHTNLDDYAREEWPFHFVAVPRMGERVKAKSGRSLKVVAITHAQSAAGPYIEIELNK